MIHIQWKESRAATLFLSNDAVANLFIRCTVCKKKYTSSDSKFQFMPTLKQRFQRGLRGYN